MAKNDLRGRNIKDLIIMEETEKPFKIISSKGSRPSSFMCEFIQTSKGQMISCYKKLFRWRHLKKTSNSLQKLM